MPLKKSQFDATFLRILANQFDLNKKAITRASGGVFDFSSDALRAIADKIERNGYDDDAPNEDATLANLRERVYGDTLAYEREQALKE